MEEVIEKNADTLANIYVMHHEDHKTACQLIMQQLEHCVRNEAETNVENFLA